MAAQLEFLPWKKYPREKKEKGETSTTTLEVLGHHFLSPVSFRTTMILVGVHHLPKRTNIFEMVVDFQGKIYTTSLLWTRTWHMKIYKGTSTNL